MGTPPVSLFSVDRGDLTLVDVLGYFVATR